MPFGPRGPTNPGLLDGELVNEFFSMLLQQRKVA